MTENIPDPYLIAEFDGVNKGTGIQVSYNFVPGHQPDPQILFVAVDKAGSRTFTEIDSIQALALLEHLNSLLGHPLTHAPSAD